MQAKAVAVPGRFRPGWFAAAAGLFLAGCASAPPDPRPVAEDLVCRYNRDLGCIRVRVDDDTPRATYRGVTYYFCADRCREAFEREPEKYVGAVRTTR